MVHIKITKGLDIPIKGRPEGKIKPSILGSESAALMMPAQIALNLRAFEDVKFHVITKVGDSVKIGQPLLEDKLFPNRMFCSPAGGVIKEIRRGHQRRLLDVVIDVAKKEEYLEQKVINLAQASRQEIIEALKIGGLFANIRSRPFNLLANPDRLPRNIFVKAIESAPFVPPAELQVEGHETEFQAGLQALAKLTEGSVHLVYRKGTTCRAFTEAKYVTKHTAEGPHPVGTHSLHIQIIDPIKNADDVVWTCDAYDVVCIGHLLTKGRYFVEKIVSVAGPSILPDRTGYFKVRSGIPVGTLIADRIEKGIHRFISGDPLMGKKVEIDEFLGYYHFVFCAIPENEDREFLHFLRLGTDKYSFSKAYLSGHLDNTKRLYDFTTNQHGEHRAFIDATLYDDVQPLPISTMLLVKAILAEDFDLAESLGLLNVDSEDFALPTFVCPSKMEMTEIVKNGLERYSKEVLA